MLWLVEKWLNWTKREWWKIKVSTVPIRVSVSFISLGGLTAELVCGAGWSAGSLFRIVSKSGVRSSPLASTVVSSQIKRFWSSCRVTTEFLSIMKLDTDNASKHGLTIVRMNVVCIPTMSGSFRSINLLIGSPCFLKRCVLAEDCRVN